MDQFRSVQGTDVQTVELQSEGREPNFIGAWILKPDSLCDDIINFFDQNEVGHQPGAIGSGHADQLKKSTDLKILPKEIDQTSHAPIRRYIDCLNQCYQKYLEAWPFLKTLGRLDVGSFNIQRYLEGDHFRQIHAERTSLKSSHRILAWMTYLNSVEKGGSTFFSHYDLEVEPEKGKTLIWPAEWTHAHRGNVIALGRKYIITGWMHIPAVRELNSG